MRFLPKHRWLRYSVRTLLLAVTLVCLWLGWKVSIVRERKALIELLRKNKALYVSVEKGTSPSRRGKNYDRMQLNAIRRGMGDEPWLIIFVPEKSVGLLNRIDAAFPE